MFTYTFYRVLLDGSLTCKENLNNIDEVNEKAYEVYGRYATIKVVRSDGREIILTDNGEHYETIYDSKEVA